MLSGARCLSLSFHRRVSVRAVAIRSDSEDPAAAPVPLTTPYVRNPETIRGSVKPCADCRWYSKEGVANLCKLYGHVHLETGDVVYAYAAVSRQFLCKGKEWEPLGDSSSDAD